MTSEEAIKLLKKFALRVKPFYEPQRNEDNGYCHHGEREEE